MYKKPYARALISMFIVIWIFSGWPQLSDRFTFLLEVKRAYAAVSYSGTATLDSCDCFSLSFSHDAGSGSNRLLVVAVMMADEATDKDVANITYDGTNMFSNMHVNVASGQGGGRIQVFYLSDPSSGSNTLSITTKLGNANKMTVSANNFTGVDTTSPVDTASTSGGRGNGGDTLNVTGDSGDMIIHMFTTKAAGGWSTNQTEQWNTEVGGSGVSGVHTVGGTVTADGTSQSMTGSWNGNKEYAHAAFNINQSTSNSLPTASSVSIDSGATSITLNEGTTKSVVCEGTVSDSDGYTDITSVTADLYRTSVGTGGGEDDNNYYQLSGDSECIPSGGSGTSETYTCTFAVQYFADATDESSPYSSDDWTCVMTPSDAVGQGTSDSDTIEMATLLALDVTSMIDYGTVSPNTDTGTTNQTTTVTNTGNVDMDPNISGTDMDDGGSNTLTVDNQKYGLSDVTYGSLTWTLSTSATQRDLVLPQSTGTTVTDDIFWGISIPNGQVDATYTGTNTFTADAGL